MKLRRSTSEVICTWVNTGRVPVKQHYRLHSGGFAPQYSHPHTAQSLTGTGHAVVTRHVVELVELSPSRFPPSHVPREEM
jgi:hypothetical protein